jgi:hypothetical protein
MFTLIYPTTAFVPMHENFKMEVLLSKLWLVSVKKISLQEKEFGTTR